MARVSGKKKKRREEGKEKRREEGKERGGRRGKNRKVDVDN